MCTCPSRTWPAIPPAVGTATHPGYLTPLLTPLAWCEMRPLPTPATAFNTHQKKKKRGGGALIPLFWAAGYVPCRLSPPSTRCATRPVHLTVPTRWTGFAAVAAAATGAASLRRRSGSGCSARTRSPQSGTWSATTRGKPRCLPRSSSPGAQYRAAS